MNINICNKNNNMMMIQTERQHDIYKNNMSINMTLQTTLAWRQHENNNMALTNISDIVREMT